MGLVDLTACVITRRDVSGLEAESLHPVCIMIADMTNLKKFQIRSSWLYQSDHLVHMLRAVHI